MSPAHTLEVPFYMQSLATKATHCNANAHRRYNWLDVILVKSGFNTILLLI
jgi:hypothetical protein